MKGLGTAYFQYPFLKEAVPQLTQAGLLVNFLLLKRLFTVKLKAS